MRGMYINWGNEGFKSFLNGEYVDKTGLIAYINTIINSPKRLTSVTLPRRFGKTATAQMFYAYYDTSSDSKELFSDLQIVQNPSYKQHMNMYPTIYLDVTNITTRYAGREDIVDVMLQRLIKEIGKIYPDLDADDDADLAFIPRIGSGKPTLLAELKWNETEHAAINQIGRRNYPHCS